MKTSPVSESSIQKNPVCHISFNFLLPPQKKKYAFSPPPLQKKNICFPTLPQKKTGFEPIETLSSPQKIGFLPPPAKKKMPWKRKIHCLSPSRKRPHHETTRHNPTQVQRFACRNLYRSGSNAFRFGIIQARSHGHVFPIEHGDIPASDLLAWQIYMLYFVYIYLANWKTYESPFPGFPWNFRAPVSRNQKATFWEAQNSCDVASIKWAVFKIPNIPFLVGYPPGIC